MILRKIYLSTVAQLTIGSGVEYSFNVSTCFFDRKIKIVWNCVSV